VPEKRLFIAIPLPDDIIQLLVAYQSIIVHPNLAWVKPENLHITVHFLGNIQKNEIHNIEEKLASLVTFPSFSLQGKEIKAINRRGKIDMIWAGFQESNEFIILATQMAQILRLPLTHPPLPHITLARVKRNKVVKLRDSSFQLTNPMILQVKKVGLYESNLTPHGPVYKVLNEWHLKDSGYDC
jgi:2'-5' RNA ligase